MLSVMGLCVDTASLCLLLHSAPEQKKTTISSTDSPRSLAVPTPRGIVLVDYEADEKQNRQLR